MLTIAHIRSRDSGIDPAYSAEHILPEPVPAEEFPYLYAPEDFLSARLESMRRAVDTAKLKVGYPGKHREAARMLFFVTDYPGGPGKFRCPGTAALYCNGMAVPVRGGEGCFSFEAPAGVLTAAVCGDAATIQPLWHGAWGVTPDLSQPALPAEEHFSSDGSVPPHAEELPFVNLPLEKNGSGLFDAGREILAYVDIHAHDVDFFRAGESPEEALDTDPGTLEQSMELAEVVPGVWRSAVPLAFRYLRIDACGLEKVLCHALFSPVCYRGAFASGDRELDDIWMRSAYTLRLCQRHFLIDGVKRDRLPWSGDLRISLLSSCFTFADSRIVENTLQILGSSGVLGHINAITDYSLWYIINQDTWQLYSGHREFLVREYPKIVTVLENLMHEEAPDTGFLDRGRWTFIDWADFNKISSLQILYFWALKAGAGLACRMEDPVHEDLWRRKADTLASRIREKFRDPGKGIYRDGTEGEAIHRHANFLAVLSGLETASEPIADLLAGKDLPEVGTPYMAAMEIQALAGAGFREAALRKLRGLWGAMLKDGATTFYEAFDPSRSGGDRYSFYDRPFGLSLCHAWGAGPAWLLPEIFFGIRPVEDGWKKFEVNPAALLPGEVHLTVPTPGGEIELALEAGKLSVKAPQGMEYFFPAGKDPGPGPFEYCRM